MVAIEMPFVCSGCGDPSPGALPTKDQETRGKVFCKKANGWVTPLPTDLWELMSTPMRQGLIAAVKADLHPNRDVATCTARTPEGLCGEVAQYRDVEERLLCSECVHNIEVPYSPLYYCGFCAKGLNVHRDGTGGCPTCEFVWQVLLSAEEAQLFRSTWDGQGPSRAGIDWPERAEACWEAVERLREKRS